MARVLEPGLRIDGFELIEPLPLGPTAALWRVAQAGNEMPLLMKMPRLETGANPINIVAFEVEQMILPKLNGPHARRFVAPGGLDNPYIVMELIAGGTLKPWLDKLPLPTGEVAAIGAKISF